MYANESQKDVENRALTEARVEALKKVNGVRVNSMSVVENHRLLVDLITAATEGHILGEEKIDSVPVVTDGRFKWRVHYLFEVAPPRELHFDPSFKVRVAIDRTVLVPGDPLRFTVTTSKDAYIHVFDVLADHSVAVLLPNSLHRDKRVSANVPLTFPSPAEEQRGIRLLASLPPNQIDATEEIVVIATKDDVDLIETDFREAVFKTFENGNNVLVDKLYRKLFQLPDSGWIQDVAPYRIVGKR